MSKYTPIEWCHSTINPTMGCDGCELWNERIKSCYAGQQHLMRGGNPGYAPTFEEVTMFPGRMKEAAAWGMPTEKEIAKKPWLKGMPRLIFVSDMSDALSKGVTFDFLTDEIFRNVVSPNGKRHQWLWLTKRPARMFEFANWLGEWPANLWAGTSITDHPTAESRLNHLLKIPAAIRFVSFEPALGPVEFDQWFWKLPEPVCKDCPKDVDCECGFKTAKENGHPSIDWVIFGGESGKGHRPCDSDRIRDGLRQCDAANVPAFVKQLGAFSVRNVPEAGGAIRDWYKDPKGGDMSEWPADLRVRQFPKLTL